MASQLGSDTENVEPEGSFIPIFCMADIPSQTLDLLLEQDARFRNWSSYRLWFVTDNSDKILDTFKEQYSKPPTQAFSSPFVGWTVQQINEFFWKNLRARGLFNASAFFVLDDLTPQDNTLVVVEARDPTEMTEEDQGLNILETDFFAARQVATLTDLRYGGLLDNRDFSVVVTVNDLHMDL